jgi:hypothetical protein
MADMGLKNAVTVCLISLFSATLVVLIARSLDSQAASQLEPRLTEIAEELRAIRRQGTVARPADAVEEENVGDGLVVFYLHNTKRCETCVAVEAQTKELIETEFAPQLGAGEIVWKPLNCDKPAGKALALEFNVVTPIVVLAKMKDNKPIVSRPLGKVMALAGDRPAFAAYVRGEIERMLAPEKKPAPTKPPSIPVPE